jgi:hypothetical protein
MKEMKLMLLCVLITTMFALNKLSRKTRGTNCKYIKELKEHNSYKNAGTEMAFPNEIATGKAIPPSIYLNNMEISLTRLYQKSEFKVLITENLDKSRNYKIIWHFIVEI